MSYQLIVRVRKTILFFFGSRYRLTLSARDLHIRPRVVGSRRRLTFIVSCGLFLKKVQYFQLLPWWFSHPSQLRTRSLLSSCQSEVCSEPSRFPRRRALIIVINNLRNFNAQYAHNISLVHRPFPETACERVMGVLRVEIVQEARGRISARILGGLQPPLVPPWIRP